MNLRAFRYLLLGVLVGSAALPEHAHAGAWTQDPGRGQAITGMTFSRASKSFDSSGDARSAPEFRKEDYEIYAEYGLRPAITALFHTRLTHLHADASSTVTGMGETEFGLRQRLWTKGRQVFSVQGTLLAPGNSVLTSGGLDGEIRVLYGAGFDVLKKPAFIDIEFAYRGRAHGFRDELRPDVTIGVQATPRWMLLAQSFNTVTIGEGRTNVFQGRQSKVELSAVWSLNKRVSLQVGGLATVAGTDVPAERALVSALWYSF